MRVAAHNRVSELAAGGGSAANAPAPPRLDVSHPRLAPRCFGADDWRAEPAHQSPGPLAPAVPLEEVESLAAERKKLDS
jgi:hypothetical protein